MQDSIAGCRRSYRVVVTEAVLVEIEQEDEQAEEQKAEQEAEQEAERW